MPLTAFSNFFFFLGLAEKGNVSSQPRCPEETYFPAYVMKVITKFSTNSRILWYIQGRDNGKMFFLFCPFFFTEAAKAMCTSQQFCVLKTRAAPALRNTGGERKRGRAGIEPLCFGLIALVLSDSMESAQCHIRSYLWQHPLPHRQGSNRTTGGGGVLLPAACLRQAGACFLDKSQQESLAFLLMPFCRSKFAFPKASSP